MATSVYDENIMSSADKQKLKNYTEGWNNAKTDSEKAAYNNLANSLRASYGYSMGADGNTFTKLPTQLNSAGVPISPVNAGLQKINTDNYLQAAQAQATAQKTTARNDYIKNLQDMATTYNQNVADVQNTLRQTTTQYAQDAKDLYNAAYQNNKSIQEKAQNNGLSSTGLGTAMQVAGMNSTSSNVADLMSERNTAVSNLQNQINTLSANYNISKDAAAQALQNTEYGIDANAYTNYFQNLLEADKLNANTYNDYILAALGYDAQAIEQAKQRQAEQDQTLQQYQLQKEIEQMNIDSQIKMLEMSNANELEKLKLQAQLGL